MRPRLSAQDSHSKMEHRHRRNVALSLGAAAILHRDKRKSACARRSCANNKPRRDRDSTSGDRALACGFCADHDSIEGLSLLIGRFRPLGAWLVGGNTKN
jgi:hypothetical protein